VKIHEKMFTGRLCGAIAVFGAFALIAATPLPKAWENWKYSREIRAGSVTERRLVGVSIPLEIFQHAQGSLDDLRVIDNDGNQVPFILRLPPGSPIEITRPATVRENIFSKGEYSQVVLDIGPNVAYHNTITFGTAGPDYIVSAEVATSTNDVDWQTVVAPVQLFRFEQNPSELPQSIRYPESNARYVRLRILGGEQPFTILHPRIEYREASPEEPAAMSVAFVPDERSRAGMSEWSLDLGSTGAPALDVGFETSEPEFRRRVQIDYSSDKVYWATCSGEIYRLERDGQKFERLSLPVSAVESADRYWRVAVVNGDDRPLEGLQPTLYMAPRRVIFWQEPGKSYLLLYGQFRAPQPVFDLAARTDIKQLASAVLVPLGPEDLNTAYVPPLPWTERHDSLMWGALILALLILGFTAIRSLSRIPSAKE
jgi:hypothetical protein